MRESDHDCVQPFENFTYAEQAAETSTAHTPAIDDATTDHAVKKNKDSGLDGLGGGRLL
ncbi:MULTISPECIES: hypothetical protein [Pseudomonas]|uniref:Uncharacterized protein n=1 Tax=Pseudomonas baetica TaxID=674054 RepID=A0ABX4Q6S6_9PSED|nr:MULTISPECIES: hypothetical protein [Pseudomonas]MDR9864210.1 hypothetical protein [Pseudomonas baetica]PKA72497.1 hypothetical protein ATI02_5558 [Pseudomonas baetica]